MDTTHSGGHHKILQMSVCPSGAAYVEGGRGGDTRAQNKKKKKRCAPKAGAKATPNSTTLRVGGACPFSASSISSLHLRDRSAPAYRRYKQTAAGHTDKVTNAGHLHLAARVLPCREPSTHLPTSSATSSALFDDVSLSFTNTIRVFFLAPAHESLASGNEGTRVRNL